MNVKLLPCPFCGQTQDNPKFGWDGLTIFGPGSLGGREDAAYARCVKCKASGPEAAYETHPHLDEAGLKKLACELWNSRRKSECY